MRIFLPQILTHGPRSKIWSMVATETSDGVITSPGPERPLGYKRRAIGDHIQDQIILFSIFGEVFASVIHDVIRSHAR